MTLEKRRNLIGWIFLLPATLLIVFFSFYPMFKAIIRSLYTGIEPRINFAGIYNYKHMFEDTVFIQSVVNTFLYLIIQVPIILFLALIFASLLNK